MLQTYKHIREFAVIYLICFIGYFVWSVYNGLTFSQIRPVFFYNQLDLTGNLILLTKVHLYLLKHQTVRILFDAFYVLLPVITTFFVVKQSRLQTPAAIALVLFNIVYAFCFSISSSVSIKIMLAFMITPFILIFRKPKSFFLASEAIRLLFILFFFSTALWKIRVGGLFNMDQMSGILLGQHNYLLVNHQPSPFINLITYLIEHPRLAYGLYLSATLAEMIFVVGFFTKKFDKVLMALFLLFTSANFFLMEINYFSWLPFLACMYYAKFTTREDSGMPKHFTSPDLQ